MKKATLIIGKKITKLHRITYPLSTKSWLVHTIRTIVKTTDKVIPPHKNEFENTRDAAKHNTSILKHSKYDFT